MSKIFNNWNVEYCRITFLVRVLKNHENIINLNRSKDILFTFNRMKQNDSLKVGEFKHEVRQFQKPYDNQQAEQISLMV